MKDIFLLNRRKCHTPMYDRDPTDPRNILGVIIEFGELRISLKQM